MLIFQRLEAHVHASGEEPDEEIQVEEECRPRCRLMFRDRGNDRDVNLGISSVPQWVEATAPRCDDPRDRQQDQGPERDCKNGEYESTKERLELLAGHLLADILHKSNELYEPKNTCPR